MKKAAVDGDVQNGSVMAGQISGLVDQIKPCKEIVEELISNITPVMDQIKSMI